MGVPDRTPDHRPDAYVDLRRLELEVWKRVGVVDSTRCGEEVHAVFDHDVAYEGKVRRGVRRGDLLVERSQAPLVVGARSDAVHRDRTEVTRLEILLPRGLQLDRVLPVQRSGDLDGIPGRIVGRAAVKPERSACVGDVNVDLVLVDPGGTGSGHLRVARRFGAGPDFEHAVVAHPADGVV